MSSTEARSRQILNGSSAALVSGRGFCLVTEKVEGKQKKMEKPVAVKDTVIYCSFSFTTRVSTVIMLRIQKVGACGGIGRSHVKYGSWAGEILPRHYMRWLGNITASRDYVYFERTCGPNDQIDWRLPVYLSTVTGYNWETIIILRIIKHTLRTLNNFWWVPRILEV